MLPKGVRWIGLLPSHVLVKLQLLAEFLAVPYLFGLSPFCLPDSARSGQYIFGM